jgi:hypothetical protein
VGTALAERAAGERLESGRFAPIRYPFAHLAAIWADLDKLLLLVIAVGAYGKNWRVPPGAAGPGG